MRSSCAASPSASTARCAVDDLSLTVPAGIDLRLHRPERLRQDDDAPDDHAHPAAGRGEIEVLGSRDTARGARSRQLPARGARPLQEDDDPPAAALLRAAQGRSRAADRRRDRRLDARAWSCPGVLDRQIETLSKGMSQKVQFISAVISNPSLLILDEPFSGLDPVNAQVLKDAVLEMRRRGTTVVFSTHDMATAERMCDRIFMIFRGRKVLDGSLDEHPGAVRRRHRADPHAGGAAALDGHARRREPSTISARSQEVRLKGDPQAFLARLLDAARRSITSRSRARRCRTSSSGSPSRRNAVMQQDPHRRPVGVRDARPDQGVHHQRHPDAGRHGGVDRARARARRTPPTTRTARSRSSITRGVIAEPLRRSPRRATRPPGRPPRRSCGPAPRFIPVEVKPDGRNPDDVRLELSDQVRSEELFAFVEIPAEILRSGSRKRRSATTRTTRRTSRCPQWLRATVNGARHQRTVPRGVESTARWWRRSRGRRRSSKLGLVARDASGRTAERRSKWIVRAPGRSRGRSWC